MNAGDSLLLLGAGGMLGRAWTQLLQQRNIPFRPLTHAQCDINDAAAVAQAITPAVSLVINCAAWTDVDGAEADEAAATRLNGQAVGLLARQCAKVNATLVHYSTDYIFNGQATQPYPVDYPTDPVNAYGRGKLVGEKQLQQAGCPYLLVRTSWLYAPWGKNFVRTIAQLAREKATLRVVNDQRGRPTSCAHLAAGTWQLCRQGQRGIWHICDGGICTWHEFASEIAAKVNPHCDVQPCDSREFPRPAKRPAYSVLDLTTTEQRLGPMPHWRDNLKTVLQQLMTGISS